MKRELKRHRYNYIEAVQAALKSLNSIPETDLQRAFEVWQTRRTNCNDAGEMYFEDFSVIVMISAINFDFYNQSRHLLNEPCNMKMFQTMVSTTVTNMVCNFLETTPLVISSNNLKL